MTKMNLFGTSFVAAIPGAALAYLMLMVVLNNFDTIPMILKVVAIATLVMASVMLLFPLYVLIWFGGRDKGKAAPLAAAPAAAPAPAEVDDDLVKDDALDEDFGDDDLGDDFNDADEFEAEDSLEDDDDDMFASDEFVAEGGLDDEFEFDDFDEDDDKF